MRNELLLLLVIIIINMAEFGAHLTSVPTTDRPSIFEVLAQDNLATVLRSATQYVCKVIAQNYPARFIWLYRYCDELYLLFDYIVQHYHLRKYGGSFSENFYHLKRIVIGTHNILSGWKLPRSVHYNSLLCLVLIPYLKLKLDQLFESVRLKVADHLCDDKTFVNNLCKTYVAIYPTFNMIWELNHLCFQLAYLFDKSSVHSPFLKLAGVQLALMVREDFLDQHKLPPQSFEISVTRSLRFGYNALARSLTHTLSIGVFFLQFLDWWYSSDIKTTTALALPIPQPPKLPYDTTKIPGDPGLCPLCYKRRTNDTALSTSGYVFCYPCIYNYLNKNGSCPITHLPSSTAQMIKLYFDVA